jgi:hypothetical protein
LLLQPNRCKIKIGLVVVVLPAQASYFDFSGHVNFCARPYVQPTSERSVIMPKYVIERELPGAGNLTDEQIKGISQKSITVLEGLGPKIQWVESYVTDDKIYCIYISPNREMIEKHAAEGGFPANKISEVKRTISPVSAE